MRFHIGIKNTTTANMSDNSIDLYFLDAITNPEYFDWNTMQMEEGSMVADVISQVKSYNPSNIKMHVDSMGGSLPIAISIYSFLKDYPAKVECKIIGFCASAATVLACAASNGKLTMPANGFHITHSSSSWNVGGTSKEIREAADVNDMLTRQMAEILASRNTKGHTADEIMALWENGDCWMSGKEAEEYGFVDTCYNEATMVTARIEEAKKMFKNAPNITAAVEETTEDETISTTIKNDFMELKKFVTAAIEKISLNKVNKGAENISAEIAEAIAQPLTDMVTEIQADVTANITESVTKLTTDITAAVTTALETKYAEKFNALETTNTNLTAELEKIAGRPTGGAGGNVGADDKPKLKFSVTK